MPNFVLTIYEFIPRTLRYGRVLTLFVMLIFVAVSSAITAQSPLDSLNILSTNGGRYGNDFVALAGEKELFAEVAKLSVPTAEPIGFAASISVDGGRIAVGAPTGNNKFSESGPEYISERETDGSWFPVAKLVADDGQVARLLART